MFDCAPNNPRKQGPQHVTKNSYGFKMVYKQPKKIKTAEEILEEISEDDKVNHVFKDELFSY